MPDPTGLDDASAEKLASDVRAEMDRRGLSPDEYYVALAIVAGIG